MSIEAAVLSGAGSVREHFSVFTVLKTVFLSR